MRRTILAAMITIIVLICCASSSWAFWPFTGDDQKKTHESLDVVIETGAENAKETRDNGKEIRDTRADVNQAKKDIQKDLQRGLGRIKKEMVEIKKADMAHNANIKPILTAMSLALVAILILMAILIFSRKKSPDKSPEKDFNKFSLVGESGGNCSICERPVKKKNWTRHLRKSHCEEVGEKMGKKVELILA